ncbi:hypothetical protein BJ138DRAFT_1100388 [Hygrophoropsis aurantiaca]|uniref:Uncharacterized protein n=1 Tax=Hygrophoropsis aurantiaca TaxID=72124 RepID=A0ACB8AHC3_9AGAM|nr:hypothetical protein BJ138DRAFT_1100388 [Hygrophoropsis aurantiaca]
MANSVGLQTSRVRWAIQYFNVAAAAVLIFDYCITFEPEVRWTWGRKWGLPRVVFTLSRYTSFAGALMTAYAAANAHETKCIIFGDASSGLLILRTYAFWGCNKKILAVLLTYGAGRFLALLKGHGVVAFRTGFWYSMVSAANVTVIASLPESNDLLDVISGADDLECDHDVLSCPIAFQDP